MIFFRYLKALRNCAVQCFNANQVTQHEHGFLREAVRRENEAFAELPAWARRLLNKYA